MAGQMHGGNLGLRLAGRPSSHVEFSVVRELSIEDLDELAAPRASSGSGLKKIQSKHHHLAKLLAQGMSPGEAGIISGYSSSRVSILQADPTFQELLAFYRQMDDEAFKETRELLGDVTRDALGILSDRLEEQPDDFSNRELLQIIEKGADRSGNGPSQKVEHNHNIGLSARLAQARDRLAEEKFIDITPKDAN